MVWYRAVDGLDAEPDLQTSEHDHLNHEGTLAKELGHKVSNGLDEEHNHWNRPWTRKSQVSCNVPMNKKIYENKLSKDDEIGATRIANDIT